MRNDSFFCLWWIGVDPRSGPLNSYGTSRDASQTAEKARASNRVGLFLEHADRNNVMMFRWTPAGAPAN